MTPGFPSRRTFALGLLAWTFLAVYGSLVPFWFQPLPIDAALSRFREIRYLPLGVASRSDFVANILLFVPLGCAAMGALRLDRESRAASWAAGLCVALAAAALAVIIEFTQVFFPPRTVSINDLVAETAGAAIGIALWWAVGQSTVEWARRTLAPDAGASRLRGWLAVYAVGFAIWQLMPFDVTIRPAELLLKVREGRVTLVPFTEFRTDVLKATWNLVADVVLWVPIGALVATHARGRRLSLAAIALIGAACGAGLEFLQVFVFSRYTDATDVVAAAVGVCAGAWAARRLSATVAAPARVGREAWILAAALWIVPLLWYHWSPFNFDLSRAQLARHPHLIFSLPFSSYYWSPEFFALSTVLRKWALAVPLGFALGAAGRGLIGSRARGWRVGIFAVGVLLFTGIELGQVFLPGRYGDATDVLIGLAGVWAGVKAADGTAMAS